MDVHVVLLLGKFQIHSDKINKLTSLSSTWLIQHDLLHAFQWISQRDIRYQCCLNVDVSMDVKYHQLDDPFLCLRFLINLGWELKHDVSRRKRRKGRSGHLWAQLENSLRTQAATG